MYTYIDFHIFQIKYSCILTDSDSFSLLVAKLRPQEQSNRIRLAARYLNLTERCKINYRRAERERVLRRR